MGESNLTEKIGRIADNIAESYSVAEELGATMPDTQNSDNLPDTLRSLPPANTYLPKSGGTMEGALILAGDPKEEMEAVTKRYVDSKQSGGAAIKIVRW